MLRIAVRLEEWRRAECRRGALPPGSPEWQAADDEVRRAQAMYYAELDFAARNRPIGRWLARIERPAAVNG